MAKVADLAEAGRTWVKHIGKPMHRFIRTFAHGKTKVIGIVGAALFAVFSVSAVAGALPNPIQNALSNVAGAVGIPLPSDQPSGSGGTDHGSSTSAHTSTTGTSTQGSSSGGNQGVGTQGKGTTPASGTGAPGNLLGSLTFPSGATPPKGSRGQGSPSQGTTPAPPAPPAPPANTPPPPPTAPPAIPGCNGQEKITSLTAVLTNSESSIEIAAQMNQNVGISAMSALVASWTNHGTTHGGTLPLPSTGPLTYEGTFDAGTTVPLSEQVTVGICGNTVGGPVNATTTVQGGSTGSPAPTPPPPPPPPPTTPPPTPPPPPPTTPPPTTPPTTTPATTANTCPTGESIASATAVMVDSETALDIVVTMSEPLTIKNMSALVTPWGGHGGATYGGAMAIPQTSPTTYELVYNAGSTIPLTEKITVGICGGTPGGPVTTTITAT